MKITKCYKTQWYRNGRIGIENIHIVCVLSTCVPRIHIASCQVCAGGMHKVIMTHTPTRAWTHIHTYISTHLTIAYDTHLDLYLHLLSYNIHTRTHTPTRTPTRTPGHVSCTVLQPKQGWPARCSKVANARTAVR